MHPGAIIHPSAKIHPGANTADEYSFRKRHFVENVNAKTLKKEQVGNDKEVAQFERNSHSRNRGVRKKLKRHLVG